MPQNDTLKSAVITDTKFYFPFFFEENEPQRDVVQKEAFRHFIPVARYKRTRWNSIFCRVARISMSAFGSFRREEGQGSPEKSNASMFHDLTSLGVFFFLLRVSDTINIDTEFYLRFHTSSCESRASLFVSIRSEILRYVLENTGRRFKFIGLSKLTWYFFRYKYIVDAFTENKFRYATMIWMTEIEVHI